MAYLRSSAGFESHPTLAWIFALALALLLASAMQYHFVHLMIPYGRASWQHQPVRGNWSDLYAPWLGSREVLLHHRNPYTPEVTAEIQRGVYGRVIDPAKPGEPKDEQRFAYPVFVALLLAPAAMLPFAVVQPVFSVLLFFFAMASVPLWLYALHVRLTRAWTAVVIVAFLGSFAVVQALFLTQLVLLVLGLMSAGVAAVSSGRLATGGVLLGLACVKPHLALLLAGCFLLWSLAGWRSRWRLAAGLGAVASVFAIGGEWLLPGWFGSWWQTAAQYRAYSNSTSVAATVFGPSAELFVVAPLVLTVFLVFWSIRREAHDSPRLAAGGALALGATLLVVPTWLFHNQVILLPIVLWIVLGRTSSIAERHRRLAAIATIAVILWERVTATLTTALSSLTRYPVGEGLLALPLYTMFLLPFVVLAGMAVLAADLHVFSSRRPVPAGNGASSLFVAIPRAKIEERRDAR